MNYLVERIALALLLVVALTLGNLLSGCAVNSHAHKAPSFKTARPQKNFKPGRRCKQLGKAVTSHVAVLVERNCFRNGLTTVNMLVLNKANKGKVAAEHAVQAVTSILGFKPKLRILFYGKTKGRVFFMTAVTGSANAANTATSSR